MKQNHIVLRSPSTISRNTLLGPSNLPTAEASMGAPLLVEIEHIERQQVHTLTEKRDVLAVAPSIPMKLIAPLEATATPAIGDVTWGVKAVGADTSPFSGKGITVAVLDTGIDANHPAFAGVEIIEKDFTGEGNGDQHGHGTHCAGTIFGRTTGSQRIGVATGVSKALIGKVLGQNGGSSESIVKAIQWAVDNGANVISMSLGIDFPGLVNDLVTQGYPSELATSRALEGYRANVQLFDRVASLLRAQNAFGQASVIIAAAGNESRRDVNPDFEITVSPPAISEGIISVAALGQGEQGLTVAYFSNTGANISGPGMNITSAKPGGGFQDMSGTSMATPHVAGVAALWAEQIKSVGILTPLSLTSRLVGSATLQGLQTGLDPFDIGIGLVRAPQA
ncbi:S8 family peptidase [Nitrosomonas communis]|uniref:Subtilase family protein n=1 Tax=Nitrosomonas communis TaxID=44574 RepID=A0A1H2PWS6_9PROT|nr:S8 family serine peptidase [Nitrosomonas communis]SDV99362.1 Subtilase family protein [Nitrosomonas communis]